MLEPIQVQDIKVTHISESPPVKFNAKVEKNTKGYNWEVTVINGSQVDEVLREIDRLVEGMKTRFPQTESKAE